MKIEIERDGYNLCDTEVNLNSVKVDVMDFGTFSKVEKFYDQYEKECTFAFTAHQQCSNDVLAKYDIDDGDAYLVAQLLTSIFQGARCGGCT